MKEERFADVLQEKMEKKKFVETILQDVIKAAYPFVIGLEYLIMYNQEFVVILTSDYAHCVCIDCDSLSAIIKDVTRWLDKI